MTEDTYSELVKIESDHENAVENFIHTIKATADDGRRYGVDISVTRVQEKAEERGGFE